MAFESYKLYTSNNSSIRHQMKKEKLKQVNFLYDHASDREDNVTINGKEFVKSPRIFDLKQVDTYHYKITVETIDKEDVFSTGDYIEYDGMTWLCVNAHNFHDLYCKGTFYSCNWLLYYQNSVGDIKSIWCVDFNSTQYNSGKFSNGKITLGSAQHMLFIRKTEDTIMFDDPLRLWLDWNVKKPTMYKVSQNDNTTYGYGKGLCCITVMEDQRSDEKDKLITLEDGTQAWICNYHSPTTPSEPITPLDETAIFSAVIIGNKSLKLGFPRTYSVSFADKNGNSIEVADSDFKWNIVSDFEVGNTINGKTIELYVDDENYLGSSFLLQILDVNDAVISNVEIDVIDGF